MKDPMSKSHPNLIIMIIVICIILGTGLLINSRTSQSKYQLTLTRVIYDKDNIMWIFVVNNIGTTTAYRVTISEGGQIIGMTLKIRPGEVYTYSYIGSLARHSPSNNATCRIDWSEDTNSNKFIHTTQWYMLTDADII